MKAIFDPQYNLVLQKLIFARKNSGRTQKELANCLGKPQSFVSKYENRERRLDVVEFVLICHLLLIEPCSVVTELVESLEVSGVFERLSS